MYYVYMYIYSYQCVLMDIKKYVCVHVCRSRPGLNLCVVSLEAFNG